VRTTVEVSSGAIARLTSTPRQRLVVRARNRPTGTASSTAMTATMAPSSRVLPARRQ
jgi:hypothetical protein